MAEMKKIRPAEDVKSTWGDVIDFLGPFSGDINIFQGWEDLTGVDEATKRIQETDPDRKIGLFEYMPFYSGPGDWNFRPEVTEETDEYYATGERKPIKEGYERGRTGYTNYPEVKQYQQQVKIKKELEQLQKEQDEEAARIAKEKAEREAFLDSPKGRMQTLWNDADKRDAILGGIADAMLETRVGVDAYGSRINRAQQNVRQNLREAEATDILEQKAQLDMMKTLAETETLMNPAQYLTNAQKNADSIVRSMIASGKIAQEDYADAFAKTLQQITVKDLTSAKANALTPMYTYAMALQETQPELSKMLLEAMAQNAIYLAGGMTDTGTTEDASTITAPKKED
jgi:hypothetical protein